MGLTKLNVLSLFSGCGGMDLGFEGGFTVHSKSVNETLTPHFIEKKMDGGLVLLKKTRFDIIFANDISIHAKNAYENYFSKRIKTDYFHQQSVVDLVKRHKSGDNVFPDNIDLVIGGFPCQDFSISGKRNGFDSHKNHMGESIGNIATQETRGQLYMWMKEVIEITKPKMFIAENVKGLMNMDKVKEIIRNDFSSTNDSGYMVLEPRVLKCADYGVPQSRERVIFIGIKKSELKMELVDELLKEIIPEHLDPYPKNTHSFGHVTVGDVLGSLVEPEKSNDLSHIHYSKAKYMGKHCQGQIEVKLDGISPTIRSEHHGNIEFRRLSKEHGGINYSELDGGLVERRLSVRECGLLQTFPIDYQFVINNNINKKKYIISSSEAYKLVGNAVPPLFAYNLARRLEEVWDTYFGK